MKKKLIALLTLFAMGVNASVFAVGASSETAAHAAPSSDVVRMLPASDMVMTVDVRRVLDEMVPRILAGKPALLAEVRSALAEVQKTVGIDPRSLGSIAMGIRFKKIDPNDPQFEFAAIARGDINANALMGIARLGANGKYREEKIGERVVYIFRVEDKITKKVTQTAAKTARTGTRARLAAKGKAAKPAAKSAPDPFEEIAVTAYDPNTLVMGTPAHVRETIAGTALISTELASLLPADGSSIFAFAGQMPAGLETAVPLQNDELGKIIRSIGFVAGSMNLRDGGAEMRLLARTGLPEQAQSLLETIQGLQTIGKAFLSSAKKPEQQVIGRMLESAKTTRQGSDVILDLSIPSSDLDMLIAQIK
ncbi:MAG: hypothetical protein ACK4S4_11065 [Pyrinomonadaceae bacterium]